MYKAVKTKLTVNDMSKYLIIRDKHQKRYELNETLYARFERYIYFSVQIYDYAFRRTYYFIVKLHITR